MGKITDAIKNSASFQELKKFDDLVAKDNPLPLSLVRNRNNDEASRLLAKNAVDEKLTPGEVLYVLADKGVDVGTNALIGGLIGKAGSKAVNRLMKSPGFKNAIRKIPMPRKWQDKLTASAADDSIRQIQKMYEIQLNPPKEGVTKDYTKAFSKALPKAEKAEKRLVEIAKDVYPPDPSVTAEYMKKALSLGIENPEQYIKPKKDFPLTKHVFDKRKIEKPAPNIRTEANPLEGILEREKPSNFDILVKNSIPEKEEAEAVTLVDRIFEKLKSFYNKKRSESAAYLKASNRKAEKTAKETAENVEKKLKAGKLAFDEKIDSNAALPGWTIDDVMNKTKVEDMGVTIPEINEKKASKIGAAVSGGGTILKDIFDSLMYKPELNAIKHGIKTVDTPAGKVNKAISYYDYNQGKISPKDLTNALIDKIEAIDKSALNENQLKSYEAIDEVLRSAGTYQNVAQWIYSPEGQKTIKALTNK